MQKDLISRSALLDDMQKELEKALNDENMSEFDCKVLLTSALALKGFVNRQPIAYDVEKVVEQLDDVLYDYTYGFDYNVAHPKMEQIVRKGGVNNGQTN